VVVGESLAVVIAVRVIVLLVTGDFSLAGSIDWLLPS